MRREGAGDAACDLRYGVKRRFAQAKIALEREHERHGGIEMRARNRAENGDQHDQNGAGRKRVAEQGERDVSARQPFPHDPGADDRRHQEAGSKAFGG